jgi:low affinity Fe/Cu permease
MKKRPVSKFSIVSNRFSNAVTRAAGRPFASILAFCVVILWIVTGPIFDYSDTWQLLINTTTTIVTFLMVFIIQQSQNKDTMALQLKLNELIACEERASNRLIDTEDLTAQELELIKKFYIKLSRLAQKENDLHSSHSIDEASVIHQGKRKKASATIRTLK